MRAVLLAVCVVVALIAVPAGEAAPGEKEDILLAKRVIAEIQARREADKRTHDRAVKALLATPEGEEQMRTCPSRDKSYRDLCLTDRWKYKGAYKALYDRFYKEELKKIREP